MSDVPLQTKQSEWGPAPPFFSIFALSSTLGRTPGVGGTDPSLIGAAISPVSTARAAGRISGTLAAVDRRLQLRSRHRSGGAALPLEALRLRHFPASVSGGENAAAPGTYLRPWPFGCCVGVAAPLFLLRGVPDGDVPSSSRPYASDALCPRAPARHAGDSFAVAVAAWTLGKGEGACGITVGKDGGGVDEGQLAW